MRIRVSNGQLKMEEALLNRVLPSDKSISQRALLVGALQPNLVKISNLNCSESILPLIDALCALGVKVNRIGTDVEVGSFYNCSDLDKEEKHLYLGSSSAAARFLIGVLVGLRRKAVIDGDSSLRARPMNWLIDPLRELGANVEYIEKEGHLPVRIRPATINSGNVTMRVGSAQAVSGLLFAAYAGGINVVIRRSVESRDHTERLLSFLGNKISSTLDKTIYFNYNAVSHVVYDQHRIPNDPSGLAYLIAAHILQNRKEELTLRNVCLNPTRIGFIELIKRSGANIKFLNVHDYYNEPVGDIVVLPSKLNVPMELNDDFFFHSMIDEVPLAVAVATQIEGSSVFSNLGELVFKETDRIKTTLKMLEAYGVKIQRSQESLRVNGKQLINAGVIPSYYDHRIAMSAVVMGSTLKEYSEILESECINTSFPNFIEAMKAIGLNISTV